MDEQVALTEAVVLPEKVSLIGEVAMTCEDYRPKLVETAAMPAEISAALQTHLEDCASCRGLFAGEQRLYAAIDGELSRVANAEATPSFLPRVRAAMQQQRAASVASHSWFVFWPVAAMAAVAVCFVVFQRTPSQPQTVSRVSASTSALTAETGSATGSVTTSPTNSGTNQIASDAKVAPRETLDRGIRRSRSFSTLSNAESQSHNFQIPEVQVPPDERIALASFVAALPRRHEMAVALTKPAPSAPSADVVSAPLQIAELKLEPLSPQQSPAEAK